MISNKSIPEEPVTGTQSKFGAVAAGHPLVVETAAEILAAGGNAFDAALGAMCTSAVVEPVLCSLGGGGFLLARSSDGSAVAIDFFCQTPRLKKIDGGHRKERDFYPVIADFGTAQQEFHIGLGAMATPGAIHGLFVAHKALGRMPMALLMAPAIAAAREGYVLDKFQGYLFSVVGPIYLQTAGARQIFGIKQTSSKAGTSVPHERLIGAGDRFRNPDLADFLDALSREGPALFYEGEVAARIVEDCRAGGGILTADDLSGYRTESRQPLIVDWHGAQILTNPPPSTGGLLIAFALELLKGDPALKADWGTPEHLDVLVRAMAATNQARQVEKPEDQAVDLRAETFLNTDLVTIYRQSLLSHPQVKRGTTHISVLDRAGNAASLTLSNGEGCGYVVPGTGVMMNNMLGEEDINPSGFDAWPRDCRMGSMMAPTVMIEGDRVSVLGSGGANRIRTAILQVLINLTAFSMSAGDAVSAPRVHFERGNLDIEPNWPNSSVDALAKLYPEQRLWPEKNLFFGGVHLVRMSPNGHAEAVGDERRVGAAAIV